MKAFLSIKDKIPAASSIEITGSKSESNRILLLQALHPNIVIENVSKSDDTILLQKGLASKEDIIDIHHAGTAMRFLTAYFAAQPEKNVILTGSERMQQRPIKILVDALRVLGANIQYCKEEGFPPIKVKGKELKESSVLVQAQVSSQYISALMLIGSSLPNGLKIVLEGKITSIPYITMTLSLLKRLGISCRFSENIIEIESKKRLEYKTVIVESDWSSASYFYSIVALSNDSSITLKSYKKDSLQGDAALVTIFEPLGVTTQFNLSEASITLSKNAKPLAANLKLNLSNTPDLAQTIAVSCFGLGVGCVLTGLHTLKIKETDRLVALKTELEKLGAQIEITDDSLILFTSKKINVNCTIDTYNDHRMAMAFAPLAIKSPLVINDPKVVSKSFPTYWEDLQRIGINVNFK